MMTEATDHAARVVPDPHIVAEMLSAQLRSKMLTLAELGDVEPSDPFDLGPEVSLPMMHMHLLLIDRDGLQARIDTLELFLEEAQRTSIGYPPLRHPEGASPPELRLSEAFDAGWSDDDRGDYAGKIAEVVMLGQNPHDAACVLFQAAVAILTVTYPPALVVRLVEAMGNGSIFDVGAQIGVGETRQ